MGFKYFDKMLYMTWILWRLNSS